MSLITCGYCAAERNAAEHRCGNCGAPLKQAVDRSSSPSSPVGHDSGAELSPVTVWERWFPSIYAMVRSGLGWPAALAGIIAVAVAGLAVVFTLGTATHVPRPRPPTSAQNVLALLPTTLASAATCWGDAPDGGARCVISAGDPFLLGIPAARGDLTFTIAQSTKVGLASVIDGWRADGGTVIEDGPEFAAIGPSATVLYASTTTGLRLDTASFANQTAAQTFLTRAGLVS